MKYVYKLFQVKSASFPGKYEYLILRYITIRFQEILVLDTGKYQYYIPSIREFEKFV